MLLKAEQLAKIRSDLASEIGEASAKACSDEVLNRCAVDRC